MDMMPYAETLIKCACAIVVAVLLGNGAVYFFNRMPAEWFCDYGQSPTPEMRDPYTQRIKSYPWKPIFTMFFIIIGITMVVDDERFALAAMLTIWLLIEMSIGDVKYRIIPDQLIILTCVTALGYIPYHDSWVVCLVGAAIGIGLMGFVALIGKLIYGENTIGGGDIKLFAALGLIVGGYGIIIVFVISTLLASAHFVILMAQKKVRRNEARPMVPYITLAMIIYLMFIWGIPEMYIVL